MPLHLPVINGARRFRLSAGKRKFLCPAILMILFVNACAPIPLGIKAEEWEQLPLDERMQARIKQADLDIAAANKRAAESEVSAIDARSREAQINKEIIELEARLRQ